MKIAHIINVTEIDESKEASYLHIAQPLTFKSMIAAKRSAEDGLDIDLVAVKHMCEQVDIPSEFVIAADIEKYAWEYIDELRGIKPRKPLPRLGDIISALYGSSDAEYFVYTNLDIGLYPNFYSRVQSVVEEGFDAFCINRRDLPKEHNGILLDENQLGLITTLEGVRHVGIDCFVFKRSIVPKLSLGNVYIGFPPVGELLKMQVEANSLNFRWIKDERLTFHIGSDKAWKNGGSYWEENVKQANRIYAKP